MKIIIHGENPAALIDSIQGDHTDTDFHGCDSYYHLPDLIKTVRPDAIYSIRFAGTPSFPADAIKSDYGPRWLAVGGAGVDHLGSWSPDKLMVTNSAGVAADMMAEFVFGGFLHFSLGIEQLLENKAHKRWAPPVNRPLAGQTLLILGLGNTGRAIAKRAQAFGLHVMATRARPTADASVDEVYPSEQLEELLPRADLLAISLPLLPETRNLIDAGAIAKLKPGAMIADVSRGGVMDHSALVEALESRHVAAAILDVFEEEPLPPHSPLWKAPNTLISPHNSSVFDGWEHASVQMFSDNLKRFKRGEALVNLVDPTRGY